MAVSVEGRGCTLWQGLSPGDDLFEVEQNGTRPDVAVTVQPSVPMDAPSAPARFTTPSWENWALPGGGFLLRFRQANAVPPTVLIADDTASQVVIHDPNPIEVAPGGVPVLINPFRMPVDQLLILHHLAHRDGCIVHAAGFELGGAAFVVPGVSGAGKSTLSTLVASEIPAAVLLSDERIVVRHRNGAWEAWGTPWMGTALIARNRGAPLRGLLFPVQAPEHRVVPISIRDAVHRLLGVVACPWFDSERSALVLRTLERIATEVPAYELRFTRDPGVGRVVEQLRDRLRGMGIAAHPPDTGPTPD